GFLYVLYIAAALLLPFLPLALALFYAILPLLLLTPFVLLIIELLQIISDFAYLKKHFRLLPLCAVFTCGMLALCGGFVGSCFAHKVNFNNALCYLSTEQEQYPDVNLGRLKTSLSNARQQGSRGLFDININQRGLPLLDVAYQGIVMDGKSLSQEVYDRMAQIFVPELASWDMVNRDKFRGGSPEVNLTDINTETQYDAEAKLYRTWVHLQLTNNSAIHNQEYAVLFDLPEGIFITDYYLDVFGEKKHGILSEKVSAKAVYESIVNRNRDPGIISYYNSGAIELRVFPFAPNETRETGFLLMHKYASGEQIKIGNYEFVLEGEDAGEPILTDDVCYMPGSYKQNLQKLDEMTARKPKYYFVLDVGQTQTSLNDILYDTAENLIRRYAAKNALPDDTVVYLTAYNVEKTDLAHMNPRTRDGGFNLGLAVEMIRRDVANHPESYPVIIAATNRFDFAISADSQKLARDYPQSEYYYLLNNDASLTTYSFADNSVQWAQETPAAILVYEGFYFKDNGQSEVSYSNAIAFDDLLPQVDDLYTNALLLQGKAEKAEVQEHVIEALKGSIAQRVLTKQSAFIVLETKEQEDELNRRNQEFLDGKVIAGPPRAAMSEPGAALAMLAVIVVLGVGIIKRRIVRQRKLT
ncbi:MAG: MSEP-CTERM sorting domain-containing protein, partial [Clostridia bacterium]|nr:MSEP-CTERM sorting domain-containing protein [Clostridia bacterium]